jgi:methylglyoxal synthase
MQGAPLKWHFGGVIGGSIRTLIESSMERVNGKMQKRGTIAFITTPKFREASPELVDEFIYAHLYELCDPFSVITTGRTGQFVQDLLDRDPNQDNLNKIAQSMGLHDLKDHDLERWRDTIRDSLIVTMDRFQGMIHVTYELVEGRVDAVIHLTDWEDKSAKHDSAVLSREANVHNVPIATDPHTARAYIRGWKRRLAGDPASGPVFVPRQQLDPRPLDGLKQGDSVLAIIAHDNMKLDTCLFAVEHARHIFDRYEYILATGTTGSWLKRFMHACGKSRSEVRRIRCCNSGPRGGDIQIAYAVVRGICQKIVFLQDPTVSHPHDSDIRLFEQAVVSKAVHVELATNVESARLLVGA